MLNLKNVSMVASVYGSERFLVENIKSFDKCLKHAEFNEVLLFHPFDEITINSYKEKYPYVNFICQKNLVSWNTYLFWAMNEIGDEPIFQNTKSTHVLFVQEDSWIVNPDAWTDEFLKYDYIGAPFVTARPICQGNSGFSLRSIKLMKYLSSRPSEIIDLYNEDCSISITNRKTIENAGFVFAPLSLAFKFSVEGRPYTNQFGHHSSENVKHLFENGHEYYVSYEKVFQVDSPAYFKTEKYLYLYSEEELKNRSYKNTY